MKQTHAVVWSDLRVTGFPNPHPAVLLTDAQLGRPELERLMAASALMPHIRLGRDNLGGMPANAVHMADTSQLKGVLNVLRDVFRLTDMDINGLLTTAEKGPQKGRG